MKRNAYIALFTLLGLLVQFIVHAVVEILYIGWLVADFSVYGLGLSWEAWQRIHTVLSIILLVGGVYVGYREGIYWWQYIYEKGGKKK